MSLRTILATLGLARRYHECEWYVYYTTVRARRCMAYTSDYQNLGILFWFNQNSGRTLLLCKILVNLETHQKRVTRSGLIWSYLNATSWRRHATTLWLPQGSLCMPVEVLVEPQYVAIVDRRLHIAQVDAAPLV